MVAFDRYQRKGRPSARKESGIMRYDKELIAHKLLRWEDYLNNYKLPAWKELPDIGLYMDPPCWASTWTLSPWRTPKTSRSPPPPSTTMCG